MRVLVVNAGSSTLKLRIVADDDTIAGAVDVDPWDGHGAATEVEALLDAAGGVDAVGHRVVHGGRDLRAPTLVDAEVEAAVARLVPLAPLHQPRALAALAEARRAAPDVPHVACFDTAFHATLGAAARTYALPREWRTRWGLDRHGFHGLSHAWCAHRAPALVGLDGGARIVSCHLGAGASLCAITGGASVDTTMGFTPLDGIVMATRAGAVDPGVILWLLTDAGMGAPAVAQGLQHRAGLAGLAGGTGDMRDVLAARAAGDRDAALAFDVYAHRLRQGIASMVATLEGVDLVAFTGGVGEHTPEVRAAAVAGMGFLGLALDPVANDAADGDHDISAAGAQVRAAVVTAREDLAIASQVRRALAAAGHAPA
jgi:acetate kinase